MKQTIISQYKGSIVFWLVVIIISAILSSCSTRKVIVDNVKKDSLSQIYTKSATKEVVKIENNITTDEFIITPLDTCKDVVVNGVKYRNAILSYKKTKDNTVKSIKVSEEKLKVQDTRVTQSKKVKDIEKTSFSLLWLLLIPIVAYIIYKIYG